MSKNENLIVANSCLILVVGLFSLDLYNPALPTIEQELNLYPIITQSLSVVYLLGFSISQIVYGPASDRFGRVPIILISLILTAAGNIVCSVSDGPELLVLSRLITGIGAGGCPVISRAVLSDTFRDRDKLTSALTIFAMASQLSPAIAPIIGGAVTTYLPWQANFVVLSVITLLACVVVRMSLPETWPQSRRVVHKKFLASYIFLIMQPIFTVYSVVSAITFGVTVAFYTAVPFILEKFYGMSAMETGSLYMVYAAGIVLGSYLTKRLVGVVKQEDIIVRSIVMLMFLGGGSTVASIFVSSPPLGIFLAVSFLVAVACGVSAPLLVGLSLHPFPEVAGAGSALQGALKMGGAGIVLAVVALWRPATPQELAEVIAALAIVSGAILSVLLIWKPGVTKIAEISR